MASNLDLDTTRKKLLDALGENSKSYFNLMKLWFQMKSTKEEFDVESRKLISRDNIHLHNAFLLAMLKKCRSVSMNVKCETLNPDLKFNIERTEAFDSGNENDARVDDGEENKKKEECLKKKPFKSKRRREDKGPFEPVDSREYAKPIPSKLLLRNDTDDDDERNATEIPIPSARYVKQEGVLPDSGLLMGRLLLNAWEEGLDGAEEKAALLLAYALRIWLTDVIVAIIGRRKGFCLHDHVFRYGLGTPLPNPWLRNVPNLMPEFLSTGIPKEVEINAVNYENEEDGYVNHFLPSRPTVDDAEQMAAFSVACAVKDPSPHLREPMNLFDVFEALQVHRSIIPSHNVFSINLERISARLNHPSKEEDEARRILPLTTKGLVEEDVPMDGNTTIISA